MLASGAQQAADAKHDRSHSPYERSQHSTTPSPTATGAKPMMHQVQTTGTTSTAEGGASDSVGYGTQIEQHYKEEETKDISGESIKSVEPVVVQDD